jgi:glycosidase
LHEEARLPMIWGEQQDAELLGFYRSLCALRRQQPVLASGTRQSLRVDGQVLAYRRADTRDSLISVLNLSQQAVAVALPAREHVTALATGPGCQALADGSQVRVSLPPLSGVVLAP